MTGISVEQLSNDQRAVYDSIMRWTEQRTGMLTMGGYAGSGKSTLISLVADRVELPAFCAYTGKATSVLRRKLAAAGIKTVGTQLRRREEEQQSLESQPFCGTIHSLIYRPCSCRDPVDVEITKPCPECSTELKWADGVAACSKGHRFEVAEKKFDAIAPKTIFVYAEKDEEGHCRLCGGKEWLRREALDRNYGLVIIDEASMVDDVMLRDLREYGVPILAVGDHGQLPPVGGTGSLMREPQLRLEKIHRQAEGNPIIALSKLIREQGRLPDSVPGDAVNFTRLKLIESLIEERYGDASPERLLEMGIVCYTNRRRVGLNAMVRRVRGLARTGRELPRKGEHVVCLRNIKERGGLPPVANGMRGVLLGDALPKPVLSPAGKKISESEVKLVGAVAFPEDEIAVRDYDMLRAQFGRDKTFSSPEELAREAGVRSFSSAGDLFDFGYAMTCHKMQGSSVKDLVGIVERPGPVSDEDWRRWLYTLVTRASEKLTLVR